MLSRCREHEVDLGEVVELEATAARCQGVRGVDELDVRLRERIRQRLVNVFVEAAIDRELRGLHELLELRRSLVRCAVDTRGVHAY
jgi:hypothetical protein